MRLAPLLAFVAVLLVSAVASGARAQTDLRGQTTVFNATATPEPGAWTEIAAVRLDSAQIAFAALDTPTGFPFADTTLAIDYADGRRTLLTRSQVATGRNHGIAPTDGLIRFSVRVDRTAPVTLTLGVVRLDAVAESSGTLWAGAPVAAPEPNGLLARSYVRAYRVARAEAPLAVIEAGTDGAQASLAFAREADPFGPLAPRDKSGVTSGGADAPARLMLPWGDLFTTDPLVLLVRSPVVAPAGAFSLFSAGVALTPVPDAEVQAWADDRVAARADACGPLVADLVAGTVGGVVPAATQDDVRAALPCATGSTDDGGLFNYGGGVFFTNHQAYAYTHRDYWEVRPTFDGRVVPVDLLEASYEQALMLAQATFGALADDQGRIPAPYGCFRVVPDRRADPLAVFAVQMHARPCADVQIGE